jgi:hypothetical protein
MVRATMEIMRRRRLRKEPLTASARRVRQALSYLHPGRDRAGIPGLTQGLARVEAVLREHLAAAQELDGSLTGAGPTVPTLVRQAGDLFRAERNLLNDLGALRAELERAQDVSITLADIDLAEEEALKKTADEGVIDLNSVRTRTEYLLDVLQAANDCEISLIQESTNRDTGVGD